MIVIYINNDVKIISGRATMLRRLFLDFVLIGCTECFNAIKVTKLPLSISLLKRLVPYNAVVPANQKPSLKKIRWLISFSIELEKCSLLRTDVQKLYVNWHVPCKPHRMHSFLLQQQSSLNNIWFINIFSPWETLNVLHRQVTTAIYHIGITLFKCTSTIGGSAKPCMEE